METDSSIRMKCPSCGAVGRGKDSYLNREIKCLKCGEVVRFIRVDLPLAPGLKRCPFCSEEILFSATKCKHCREWLNLNEDNGNLVGSNCLDGACIGHIMANGRCSVCGLSISEAKAVDKTRPTELIISNKTSKREISGKSISCPNCKSLYTNCKREIGCVVLIIIFTGVRLIIK